MSVGVVSAVSAGASGAGQCSWFCSLEETRRDERREEKGKIDVREVLRGLFCCHSLTRSLAHTDRQRDRQTKPASREQNEEVLLMKWESKGATQRPCGLSQKSVTPYLAS